MSVKFVSATETEVDVVAADLQAREDASQFTLPAEFFDGSKITCIRAFTRLGFTKQPTLMQYAAYTVILLESAGYEGARELVHDRMGWFLALYEQSVEPELAAGYIFVNVTN